MAVVKRRTKPMDIFKKMSEEDERKEIQNQEIVEETIEETIEEIEEVNQEQQYNLENFKASKSKQKKCNKKQSRSSYYNKY
ncbi:hypothetical protein F1C14_11220 [Clostridium perfringens]|nr:hypothetical protein F1C14_11220 [Clostridium perfringens]